MRSHAMERAVFAAGRLARRAAFDISPLCTSLCQDVTDFFSTENNATVKSLFCINYWHSFNVLHSQSVCVDC